MEEMEKEKTEEKTGKQLLKAGALKYAVVAVLCVSAAVFLYIFLHSGKKEETEQTFSKNAQIGIMPGKTEEQVKDMLQKQLDDSMVSFSINSNPVFKDGKSKGKLMLEAPANNHNNLEFIIRRDDTGEIIYESGLLKPNQYILEDKLNPEEPLKKGSYSCTADIRMYDKKTNKMKGMVQAGLTITIEK